MSGWNKPLEGLEFNSKESLHSLEFSNSQIAWEKLNEGFLRLDSNLFDYGAVANNGVAVCYNVFIKIDRAWVDPDFDFGRAFNYKETKWVSLLNNYIDFNRLDLIKSSLNSKKNSRVNSKNYNISYIFNNTHNNGKQCLLSATFSKRFQSNIPVVTMIMRSSEITKRLLFDFLLIQRMSEYIYGKNQPIKLNLFATQMYGNLETLLMYCAYKPFKKVMKGVKKSSWFTRISEVYNKFMKGSEKDFSSYKIYLRAFKVLRPDLFKYTPLLVKDLTLLDDEDIIYPEDCINFSQRRKYRKKYLSTHTDND